jgi:deoxycytidylate deaminase
MHEGIFNTLRVLAEDVAPIKSSRMTAAIVRGKDIISLGANQMRTHPFQAKFGKNPESLFWHAETNAIYNALRVMDVEGLKKADLYVCRGQIFQHQTRAIYFWQRQALRGLR